MSAVATMTRLTVADLRAHRARFLGTAVAIALGVAFMAGTLVLTTTLSRAYGAVARTALAGTDALVRSDELVVGDDGTEVRSTVDDAVLTAVRATPGVAAAAPRIEGVAQVVGPDGHLLRTGENRATPRAQAWIDDAELSPLALVAGSAPSAAEDVVVDRATARAGGFAVGDRVEVVGPTGPDTYTVSGIATFGGADDAAGAPVVAFTPATAAAVLGEAGRYDAIAVRAGPDVRSAELVRSLHSSLAGAAAGVEVLDHREAVADEQARSDSAVGFMGTFLLAFALVALLVGSFVIANTFAITVAQRTRERALLRALGASRRQVTRATLIEAVVAGVVASALGVLFGIGASFGLRAVLVAFGLDLPAGGLVVTPAIVLGCITLGALVTVAAAWIPARRAGRVPPLAALRDVAVDRSAHSVVRAVLGALVTAGGVALLVRGLQGHSPGKVGEGAIALFLGVAVLGPVLARPASRVLGAPLPRLRGITGTLARENASRNPRRTAATASALMIGAGLVVFITVFASSARASFSQSVGDAARCDWVVATTYGQGGLSPRAGAAIADLPEVAAMSPLQYSPAEIDGRPTTLSAIDPVTVDRVADLEVVAGSVADLGTDEIAVQSVEAERRGLAVGDELRVHLADAGTAPFRVVAIYDAFQPVGTYTASVEAIAAHGADRTDDYLMVTDADGVSLDAARAAISAVLQPYPTAELFTIDEFTHDQAAVIDQQLGLIDALLGLAVLIAFLGIAVTLGLSVHERTRELALLRAVGMARSQARSMVRWEAVLVVLLGSALGAAVGVGLAAALVASLGEQGFEVFRLPVGELAVIVVVFALAGVLVAVPAAHRASKVPVLDGLAAG